MKTILFLTATTFFVIFALAGCGKTTDATNNATAQNTAGTTNTAPTKTDAATGNILKPGDVSSDKAVKVTDLVSSVGADKAAWKGKEVAVTGFVTAVATSGNIQTLTIMNDETAANKIDISCTFKGDKPDVFRKTIEVKGKINYINTDSEYKSVALDPCEIKK